MGTFRIGEIIGEILAPHPAPKCPEKGAGASRSAILKQTQESSREPDSPGAAGDGAAGAGSLQSCSEAISQRRGDGLTATEGLSRRRAKRDKGSVRQLDRESPGRFPSVWEALQVSERSQCRGKAKKRRRTSGPRTNRLPLVAVCGGSPEGSAGGEREPASRPSRGRTGALRRTDTKQNRGWVGLFNLPEEPARASDGRRPTSHWERLNKGRRDRQPWRYLQIVE